MMTAADDKILPMTRSIPAMRCASIFSLPPFHLNRAAPQPLAKDTHHRPAPQAKSSVEALHCNALNGTLPHFVGTTPNSAGFALSSPKEGRRRPVGIEPQGHHQPKTSSVELIWRFV